MNLLTPEQQQYLSQAGGFYQNALQGTSPEEQEQLFQQSYVAPAMKQFQETLVPQLQQRFLGADTSESSALNQALASAASDLTQGLASQKAQFGQQQFQNQMAAAQGLTGVGQANVQQPYVTPYQSTIDKILEAAGQVGGAALPWYAVNRMYPSRSQGYGRR